MNKPKVMITHRGWAGHFCAGQDCLFHLNTLIQYKRKRIVVSTVGMYFSARYRDPKYKGKTEEYIEEIGLDRYYETMAFYAVKEVAGKKVYWDADVSKCVDFDSKWAYQNKDNENEATEGHAKVVDEIAGKMKIGKL